PLPHGFELLLAAVAVRQAAKVGLDVTAGEAVGALVVMQFAVIQPAIAPADEDAWTAAVRLGTGMRFTTGTEHGVQRFGVRLATATVPAMLIPVADRQPACPGPSVAPGTTVLQVPVDGVDDGPLGAGNRQSVLLKTFTLGNEIPTALAAQVRIAVHRHLAALS